MAMDDGFGSIEVRFGAVDVRRFGSRAGTGWDDMADSCCVGVECRQGSFEEQACACVVRTRLSRLYSSPAPEHVIRHQCQVDGQHHLLVKNDTSVCDFSQLRISFTSS
jgi:hypothetical protein